MNTIGLILILLAMTFNRKDVNKLIFYGFLLIVNTILYVS